MSLTNIKTKLSEAISIKSEMLSAFGERGMPVTSSTPFSSFPSFIMSIHDALQSEKTAFPMASGVTVLPDAGYDAIQQVIIPSEPNLLPGFIMKGHSIYSVEGIAEAEDVRYKLFYNNFTIIDDVDGLMTNWSNPRFLCSNNTALSFVYLPSVSQIPSSVFYNCSMLRRVYLPLVTEIPSSAFYGCIQLSELTLGSVTMVGSSAFYGCSMLDPYPFVKDATSVSSGAFMRTRISKWVSCIKSMVPANVYAYTQLSEIPVSVQSTLTSIQMSAFAECKNLTGTITLSNCSIFEWAIASTGIQDLSITSCRLSGSVFQACSNLSRVFIKNCSVLGTATFSRCVNLAEARIENTGSSYFLQAQYFAYCVNLRSLYIKGPINIGTANFVYYCASLYSVYIDNPSVITLNSSGAFSYSPIGSRVSSAHIFVPASLISAYQTANNWSHFSSLFSALEEI